MADTPVAYQVKNSFITKNADGLDVNYREGEPISADDPAAQKWPEHIVPIIFPHEPWAEHVAPDVDDEVSYGELQAEAKILGLSAAGSRAVLVERIADERERLAVDQGDETEDDASDETPEA